MTLLTPWGAALDPDNLLAAYPRPQVVRSSYLNLNGYWDYTVTDSESTPTTYDTQILVPFSPEAELSGVNRMLQAHETAWYRRIVNLEEVPASKSPQQEVILVHFGAVDQTATVFVDGHEVAHHRGGYLPFTVTIDPNLVAGSTVELVVKVQDPTDTRQETRGKQKTERGGIWYTPQSGIWQPVWAERVPRGGVKRIDYSSSLAENLISVTVTCFDTAAPVQSSATALTPSPALTPTPPVTPAPVIITVKDDEGAVFTGMGTAGEVIDIPIDSPKLWSPESPHLYSVDVEIQGVERVSSYCGMREFSTMVGPDGLPRLALNGAPYFHAGILDQGYWPDGLYTAPHDDAFVWDLELIKSMGFNMVRKHIKVEPMRFYYHCDVLGLIVWQDMINGGSHYKPRVITLPVALPLKRTDTTERDYKAFGRTDPEARDHYESELVELIEHLRGVVSIAVWVPFNEGWGQFDSARIAANVKALDPTRTVDHASGWYDQKAGDVRSLHVYFKKFRMPRNDGSNRPVVLSEYGGYNYSIPGTHTTESTFGYRKISSPAQLAREFAALHKKQILPAVQQGLSATVYTQLSDVEDEMNGLASYDRRHVKIAPELVCELNQEIKDSLPK